MHRLDRIQTFALFGALTLFVACGDAGTKGAGGDADSDAGGDGDSDPNADTDTGVAQLYYVGEFVTSNGEFGSARFGYSFVSVETYESVCDVIGDLYAEGSASDCPECDWAFKMSGVQGSVASGPACDALSMFDGDLDGAAEGSWAFRTYSYDGTTERIVYFDNGYGWVKFAYNDGERYEVTGGAANLSFEVPNYDGAFYGYYQY